MEPAPLTKESCFTEARLNQEEQTRQMQRQSPSEEAEAMGRRGMKAWK